MGAKDWMLMYAADDIRTVLKSAPMIDRAATRSLVTRLYPDRLVTPMDDGSLSRANPPDYHVYAGTFPGLAVICTDDVALNRPSTLDQRFLDEAHGRNVYLHAMHSVVDWFSYAVWEGDGRLRRALSLSPDSGIIENHGDPMDFERPYWAGEHRVDWIDDEDDEPYPLPFHPLELAEDALRSLFGFTYEGLYHDDDPDLARIVLARYTVYPRTTP